MLCFTTCVVKGNFYTDFLQGVFKNIGHELAAFNYLSISGRHNTQEILDISVEVYLKFIQIQNLNTPFCKRG